MKSITGQRSIFNENTMKITFLVTLTGSFIVLAAFFLPYASATEEYRDFLKSYFQEMNVAEIGMTNGDAINVSLFEFAKMYGVIYRSVDKELGMIIMTIIGAIGVLSLITVLFAALKKPIGILIFNCLTYGAFSMLTWDFRDRGVMPNSDYNWGISYYLYYIGSGIIFVSTLWLLISKIKLKPRKRNETTEKA